MEYEEYENINNDSLIDYEKDIKIGKNFIPPKVEQNLDKMEFSNNEGSIINYEKVNILKDGEYSQNTYYKSNGEITSKKIKKFVTKLEPDYYVDEVKYEFHGGPPMGTIMFDYREIQGENVWIVNLKPKLKSYLQKQGKLGDMENSFFQIGGEDSLNEKIIKTINTLFFIEDKNYEEKEKLINDELEEKFYYDVSQINTHFDGNSYYTFINILKDGVILDKVKVISKINPIPWRTIVDAIFRISKDKKFYGNIYNLSHSFNRGLILETTDDYRYEINYECLDEDHFKFK